MTKEEILELSREELIAEIDRQMGPLRKQAEDAKKYLEYKGQLKDLEVNAYVFQYENSHVVKGQIQQRITALEEELAARQAEIENLGKEYDAEMNRLSDYDKQIAKLNDELLKLSLEIEKQEGDTKVVR